MVKESGCSSMEQKVLSDTTKSPGSSPAGDGRIVVGRWFTDQDKWYTSIQIDELIFFNRFLSSDEIAALATTA